MDLASKSLSVLIREIFFFSTTLLTSITIARNLGPEIVGIWIILQIIPSYAEMFGRTKVDIAAVYFLGKKAHSIGDVTATLNLIAGVVSVFIILIVALNYDFLSGILLKENSEEYSIFLAAILMIIPLNFFYLNYFYLHIFNEDVRFMNVMVISKALSMSFLIIPGLLFFDFGIKGLVISTIVYMLSLTLGVYRFENETRSGPLVNLPLIRDLFGYSYKEYLSGSLTKS